MSLTQEFTIPRGPRKAREIFARGQRLKCQVIPVWLTSPPLLNTSDVPAPGRRTELSMLIRPATPADLDAINAIYNHYVLNATCTYQEVPSTSEERAVWFGAHGAEHPVTV